MAYDADVSVERVTVSGRRQWIVTVVETDAATASEYEVGGLPPLSTLRLIRSTLISGDGATVAPVLGNEAAFVADTQAHLASYGTPAAHINENTPVRVNLPDGKLFIRSGVNAGADNVISTVLVLVEGVQD